MDYFFFSAAYLKNLGKRYAYKFDFAGLAAATQPQATDASYKYQSDFLMSPYHGAKLSSFMSPHHSMTSSSGKSYNNNNDTTRILFSSFQFHSDGKQHFKLPSIIFLFLLREEANSTISGSHKNYFSSSSSSCAFFIATSILNFQSSFHSNNGNIRHYKNLSLIDFNQSSGVTMSR
jgi:hypothetical protein